MNATVDVRLENDSKQYALVKRPADIGELILFYRADINGQHFIITKVKWRGDRGVYPVNSVWSRSFMYDDEYMVLEVRYE